MRALPAAGVADRGAVRVASRCRARTFVAGGDEPRAYTGAASYLITGTAGKPAA